MAPDTSSFSEELRQATAEQWDRVVTHRFSTELAEGTIDVKILDREDGTGHYSTGIARNMTNACYRYT